MLNVPSNVPKYVVALFIVFLLLFASVRTRGSSAQDIIPVSNGAAVSEIDQDISQNGPESSPHSEPEYDEQTASPDERHYNKNADLLLVTRVIDGDTIELEGGDKVRYIGIDTPETVHPSKPVECFGIEAKAKNKELVEGKYVHLEKDFSEADRYGRLLRYVYVGDIFVNDYLVSEGYANASSYPPDIKYQEQFQKAEVAARTSGKGLWTSCSTPYDDYSAPQFPQTQTEGTVSNSCPIKGNISYKTGEKIYHIPGQQYYSKTQINETSGERWFCTEEEAIAAGWRKSKR